MKPSQIPLLVLLLGLVAGCTHTVKIQVAPTALPAGEKLPYRTALVLNSELADFKYEQHMMGDTWVYPFGPALVEYARNTTEHSFQSVEVVSTLQSATNVSNADIVLIPRPLKTEQGVGVFAWDKSRVVMAVEWVAKDRAAQNTIWLDTITAEAERASGNMFTGASQRRKLFQDLFDDLSLQTHEAFREAYELRKNKE